MTMEKQRSLRQYLGLVGAGFAIGAANVIPGVSGGTMAFVLGIYEELILAIGRVSDLGFVKTLLRLQLRKALNGLPWRLLLAVGVGVLLAVVSLAPVLERSFESRPVLVWGFFFGLVLASIPMVFRHLERPRSAGTLTSVALGAVTTFAFVGLVPVTTPEAPWFIALSGAIAISGMILPGVSGAFILVLLGKYRYILAAVNDRDVTVLLFFGIGIAAGLVGFVRFLSWLLEHHREVTIAALVGMMAGSLRKVWPWKEVLETTVDRHGGLLPIVESNILPSWNGETAVAVGLALLGLFMVWMLERASKEL